MDRNLEILQKVISLVKEGHRVSFEPDETCLGENTMTIWIDDSHSHVGVTGEYGTEEVLLEQLHALLCRKRGLSFA